MALGGVGLLIEERILCRIGAAGEVLEYCK